MIMTQNKIYLYSVRLSYGNEIREGNYVSWIDKRLDFSCLLIHLISGYVMVFIKNIIKVAILF